MTLARLRAIANDWRSGVRCETGAADPVMEVAPELLAVAEAAQAVNKAEAAILLLRDSDVVADAGRRSTLLSGWMESAEAARGQRQDALAALLAKLAGLP